MSVTALGPTAIATAITAGITITVTMTARIPALTITVVPIVTLIVAVIPTITTTPTAGITGGKTGHRESRQGSETRSGKIPLDRQKSGVWQGCRNAVSAFRDTRAGMSFGKGTVSYQREIYF